MITRIPRPLDVAVIAFALLGMLMIASPGFAARLAKPRWDNLTSLSTNIPGDRSHHSMVIDPPRNRVIMWSGHNEEHELLDANSVWVLDLCTMQWTEVATTGTKPLPMHGHSAVMLPEQQKLIVLMGSTNAGASEAQYAKNQVWQLNLASTPPEWTLIHDGSGTAPCPRWHSAAVTEGNTASNAKVILFGGRAPFGGNYNPMALNDTWALQQSGTSNTWTWSLVDGTACSPSGDPSVENTPDRRYKHAIIHSGDAIYTFGGDYDQDVSLVTSTVYKKPIGQAWQTTAWSEVSGTDFARSEHSAIYDPIGSRMIVFGGFKMTSNFTGAPILNYRQTQMLTGTSCSSCWDTLQTSNSEPPARKGHAAVYDAVGDRMILFGGQLQGHPVAADGPTTNDTWQLVFGTPAPPVTSLSLQAHTSQTATLNWNHPMSMGAPVAGLCLWDVRSSPDPITTDTEFDSATPITSAITKTPSGAGFRYSTTFTVGNPNSFGHYAVRSITPNPISNEVCFKLTPFMYCMEELRTELEGPPTPARLSLSVPNPGDRRFVCTMTVPGTEAALLTVHDVAGRSVERHMVNAGTHAVRIGDAAALRPGFYMVVLRQGANESRRSVIVR